jgi:VWA domain-containing protein
MRLALLFVVTIFAGCQAPMYAPVAYRPAPPGYGVSASVSVDVSVSFFGIPLAGAQDVVFVLDRSGSMALVSAGVSGKDLGMGEITSVVASLGASIVNDKMHGPLPSKMDVAKGELIRTLQAMPDGTRFSIVFFDDKLATFSSSLVTLDPNSRGAAIGFIRGIQTGGSTAAVPAMRLAYTAGAQRIVLLSDGLANTGGSGGDLLAEARAAMRNGVRIDTVGLGIDQDADLLRTLASESGGMIVTR